MQLKKRFSVFRRIAASVLLLGCVSCEREAPIPQTAQNTSTATYQTLDKDAAAVSEPNQTKPNIPQWTHPRSDVRIEERRQMVEVLKRRYEMTNQKILQAMLDVPRHWFVPAGQQSGAYADSPLPIGHGQTISQPFIVAYMTQLLELTPESKVLEIGTGSGYQAAVLSELTPHVFSIEIVEPLGKRAVETFAKRSYSTIRAKIGDGIDPINSSGVGGKNTDTGVDTAADFAKKVFENRKALVAV